MISDKSLPELKTYRQVEGRLPVEMRPEFGDLVTFGLNDSRPVHRWFRFKEGYSSDLLGHALLVAGQNKAHLDLLDCFCGSGTTLVSAQEFAAPTFNATGIERNPFLHFVSQAKVSWPTVNAREFLRAARRVLKRSENLSAPPLPELTSISSGKCITRYMAENVLLVRAAIEEEEQPYRDLLLLGLASCVEPVSKTRKDGRALRLVGTRHNQLLPLLNLQWATIAGDIEAMQVGRPPNVPKVILGDGRRPLSAAIAPESMDLILTSPPYPNNIDYSEVYKLELWLLGFVKTEAQFLRLRKRTFRSHPTANLKPEQVFEKEVSEAPLRTLFEPLLDKFEETDRSWRKRLILGYFADIQNALKQQLQILRRGGSALIVVANSLHGGKHRPYVVPTDLMVAALGKNVGFDVERIMIARSMKRRLSGNHFLRESIVVLRKPA